MRSPVSCVLDIDTKDTLKAWLRSFRHSDDIFVDIDGNRIEFTTMDDRGHMQIMTMPSNYSKWLCRMYKIKDLLGEEEE